MTIDRGEEVEAPQGLENALMPLFGPRELPKNPQLLPDTESTGSQFARLAGTPPPPCPCLVLTITRAERKGSAQVLRSVKMLLMSSRPLRLLPHMVFAAALPIM